MSRKLDFSHADTKALALVCVGGATCLGLGAALWLGGTADRESESDVRGSGPARATLATQALAIPDAAVPTPRDTSDSEEPTTAVELDLELVAGEAEADVIKDDLTSIDPVRQGQALRLEGERAAPDAAATRESVTTNERSIVDAGERPTSTGIEAPSLEPCGVVECPVGRVCCNPSCGTCVLPGETCSRLTCSMPAFPSSAFCGWNTCSVGEVCCNLSCGICAPPGAACSQRSCD